MVDVSAAENGGITLRIIDTGVGMSPDELATIFDAFVQVDRSVSRKQSGTGLGLAISKRIVEMMGSTLEVSSELGQGSTFAFTLTSEAVEVNPATDQRLAGLVSPNFLVYLLDDHATRSNVLCNMVADFGISVKAFTSHQDLMAAMKAKLPTHLLLHSSCFYDQQALEVQLRLIRKDLGYRHSVVLVAPRVSLETGMPLLVDALLAGFCSQTTFCVQSSNEQARRHTPASPKQSALSSRPASSTPSDALVPKAAESSLESAEEPSEQGRETEYNVLVVDDNKVNRTLLKHHLKRLNLSFLEAENGEEAVEAMKQHRFQLILMDCAMPIKDGYQAASEIRKWEQQEGENRRHIIAVTAHALEGERERCLAAGMDDYLTKPLRQIFCSRYSKNFVRFLEWLALASGLVLRQVSAVEMHIQLWEWNADARSVECFFGGGGGFFAHLPVVGRRCPNPETPIN